MQDKVEEPSRAYSVPEARERLGGISHAHFYELVKNKRLKITKLGRRTVVTDAAIRSCLCDVKHSAA